MNLYHNCGDPNTQCDMECVENSYFAAEYFNKKKGGENSMEKYKEKVRIAWSAAQEAKSPELYQIAFNKILDYLLYQEK